MSYSIHLLLALATLGDKSGPQDTANRQEWLALVEPIVDDLLRRVEEFGQQPVTPARAFAFEREVQEKLRELGRRIVQRTYNQIEPAVAHLPSHVQYEAMQYTRLNAKTPQNAWTLFGQIRVWRTGYRPTMKTGDATIFPLALSLGLVQGASPALAERAGWLMGSSGMSQALALARLKQDCGVGWGVKKLRQVTDAVAERLTEQRHDVQVVRLLELLTQAFASKGKHKPVLSVGRDGITMGMRIKHGGVFEVATTGTVTVLDRRGKRLGTVYLGFTPEPGQKTMSQALTTLLVDVLERWQGPLPRLSYVTDAGDNETTYYEQVLAKMKHPRTGEKLHWIRVVDYYHASERLWKMGDRLFGKGARSTAWVRKMQKLLLKPGGVNRVLHSAAALRDRYGLKGAKLKEFRTAYAYLRTRMRFMRYAEYRSWGVPLGSGVTEAACKTLYTQRLKLSGMRWRKPGAQTILNLRVLQLSGVWDQAYQRMLTSLDQAQVGSQPVSSAPSVRLAA